MDGRAAIGGETAEPALEPSVGGPGAATGFAPNPRALSGGDVLRLQGGAGNAAVARMLQDRQLAREAEAEAGVVEEDAAPLGAPAPEEDAVEDEEAAGSEPEDERDVDEQEDVPEDLPAWVDPPDSAEGGGDGAEPEADGGDDEQEGGEPLPGRPPQTGPPEDMRVVSETGAPEEKDADAEASDAHVARMLARRPAPPEAGHEPKSGVAAGGGGDSGAARGGPTKGPPRGGSRVGIVSIDGDEPAKLRKGPSTNSQVVKALPFNTRVFITGKRGEWLHVTTAAGDFGYVYDKLVKQNLPEPGAFLYRIQSGVSAIGIAEHYYKGLVEPGEDLRFFVNVLEYVNRGNGDRGIYQPNPDDRSRGAWKNVKTRDDFLVWIPSGAFAKSLKGIVKTGSLTGGAWAKARSALKAVENFAIGGGAFVAGLLDGAFSAVKDLLTGLGSLASSLWKVVKSLFTGRILGDAKRIWDLLTRLDVKDIAEDWIKNFVKNWTAKDTWSRWKFRGYVAGYAVAEVAMILLTSGGSLAVKLAAKMGKLGGKLTGLVKGFNAKLSKAAATATKSRLLGRQLGKLGLGRLYVMRLKPAEREATQQALNRWNLAGNGKSQGVIHILDYAKGKSGAQKTGRLQKLEDYTGLGPFSLKDHALIPEVTRALDTLIAGPNVKFGAKDDLKVWWIPHKDVDPGNLAKKTRGTIVLKYDGRYSSFHPGQYREFLRLTKE